MQRITPIANREQLAAAIKSAQLAPAGSGEQWYVIRVARAMGLQQMLPDAWRAEADGIVSMRVYDETRAAAREEAKQLAVDAARSAQAADTGEEALAVAASAATRAVRSGWTEFPPLFESAVGDLLDADLLYPGDAAAIVAAGRKVASEQGASFYKLPIGTPLGLGHGEAGSDAEKAVAHIGSDAHGSYSGKSAKTLHAMPGSVKASTQVRIMHSDGRATPERLLHTESDGSGSVTLHTSDARGSVRKTTVPANSHVETYDAEPGKSKDWASKTQALNTRKAAMQQRMAESAARTAAPAQAKSPDDGVKKARFTASDSRNREIAKGLSDDELAGHLQRARDKVAANEASVGMSNHNSPHSNTAAGVARQLKLSKSLESARALHGVLKDEHDKRAAAAGDGTETAAKAPTAGARADETASKPAAAAPRAFVKGKQLALGDVKLNARGQDPERFKPKTSLGDGHLQRNGDRVMDRKGRTGTIAQTYQLHAGVHWDDGKKKTVSNSTLNHVGSSGKA